MRSNREFLKSLSALRAGFYLSDFHVHSPGSADMCIGDRYDALSDDEKKFLPQIDSLSPEKRGHSTFPRAGSSRKSRMSPFFA